MQEVWKPLKDVVENGDKYSISTHGRIRNDKSGVIKNPSIGDTGYLKVILFQDKKSKCYFMHRLVALAFIPNPDNKPVVNHKDGNRTNNLLSNLEWATHSENTVHAIETGLFAPSFGEDTSHALLVNKEVVEIKKLLMNSDLPIKEIARMFGVTSPAISKIKSGMLWSHIEVEGFIPSAERQHKGSKVKAAKLTDDDVRKIREMFATGNYTKAYLARMFAVSHKTIRCLLNNTSWKHVI